MSLPVPVKTGQGIGKRINCHNNPYPPCDSFWSSSEDETYDGKDAQDADEDIEEDSVFKEELKSLGKGRYIRYIGNQTHRNQSTHRKWHFASKPSFLSMQNPNNLSASSASSSSSSSLFSSPCSSMSKIPVANCKPMFASCFPGKCSKNQEINTISSMDTASSAFAKKPLKSPLTAHKTENRVSLVKDNENFEKSSASSSSSEKRMREEKEKKISINSKSTSSSSLSKCSKEKISSSSKSGSEKVDTSTSKLSAFEKSGKSEQKTATHSSSSSKHKKEKTSSSSSHHHHSCSSVDRKQEKERISSSSSKRSSSKDNSDVKRKSSDNSSRSKSEQKKSEHKSSKENRTSSSNKRKHTEDLLQNPENDKIKHSTSYSNEKLRDEKYKEKKLKRTESSHHHRSSGKSSSKSTKTKYSEHHHHQRSKSSEKRESTSKGRRDANDNATKANDRHSITNPTQPRRYENSSSAYSTIHIEGKRKRLDSNICIVKPIIIDGSCNSNPSSALSTSVYNYRSTPAQMLWGPENKMALLEHPITTSDDDDDNNFTVTDSDLNHHHLEIDWDFVEDILHGCSTEDLMALIQPNL